jgi:hypothetical protein
MTCWNCGLDGPKGAFCARCGAQQGIAGSAGARRTHRYAANPDEPVYYPGLFSSLFPHLDSQQLHAYRVAFLVGLGLVLLLFAVGLVTSAFLAAATLLPLLGLLFLIEQRPAPAELPRVLLTTVAASIALGLVAAIATSIVSLGVSPFRGADELDAGGIVVFGVFVPIGLEIGKAALALSLRRRPNMTETIDGVVLGAVIGLMVSFGSSLVVFAQIVPQVSPVSNGGQWIFTILATGIVVPFLHAASTAAIAGSLWRNHIPDTGRAIAIVLAGAGQIALVVGTYALLVSGRSLVLVLAWQAVVVAGELLLVRGLVHRALLEEAAGVAMTARTCPNCHLHVEAAGFCPNCGLALAAVPRSLRAGQPPIEEGAARA